MSRFGSPVVADFSKNSLPGEENVQSGVKGVWLWILALLLPLRGPESLSEPQFPQVCNKNWE